MRFNLPLQVNHILSILNKSGFEAFVVGGCVRDFLLGIEPKDYDICTSALPQQVRGLFVKTVDTGIRHGTITVIENGQPFEVTTFRAEAGYTDHRRPDTVTFHATLKEDLIRRDFTMNALAYNPYTGIIDLFDGESDIHRRIVRTVGKAEERFNEDALRMLRAIRFQARFGFSIATDTFNAIKAMAKTIGYVSKERVLSELNRIMIAPFAEAFLNLYHTGLGEFIFPFPMKTLPCLGFLKALPQKLPLRWAALFMQMEDLDIACIEAFCTTMTMSTALKKEILLLSCLLKKPLPLTGFTIRKTICDSGLAAFSDSLEIRKAFEFPTELIVGIVEERLKETLSKNHCIRLSDLAVKGSDLIRLGIRPGKGLGDLLDILFLIVLQKPELNQKELLLAFALCINRPGLFSAFNK